MHAKSPSTQPDERAPVDFVSDLEDLADVANVQMAIWQVIANAGESQGLSADLRLSKVQGLEKRLLTVQEVSRIVCFWHRRFSNLFVFSFTINTLCPCSYMSLCLL
jgi:hypothetical protein